MFNLFLVFLLPLLCVKEVATFPWQSQQQQQQRHMQPYVNRLPSVNEKQIATITNYMNRSANPCTDFFNYACGNWPIHHDTKRYTEVTGFIDHRINKKLVSLLEEYGGTVDRNGETDWSQIDERIFKKAWSYYRSCRREKTLELRRYLELVRPAGHLNWPVLQMVDAASVPWPKGRFSWLFTLGKLRRYGFKGTIFDHLVWPNMENGDEYAIDFDQADINSKLPRNSVIVDMFRALGLSMRQISTQINRIKKLEKNINQLLETDNDIEVLYEVNVNGLEELVPEIAWHKYLRIAMVDNYSPDDNFTIRIRNTEYFRNIVTLLEHTEPEVICNYIMIKFLDYLIDDGRAGFDKIDCVIDLRSKMELALNYIYRQRFYTSEANIYERQAREILNELRKNFEQMIELNKLEFEPEEIVFLKEKLHAVRINFGNLPYGDNDEEYAANNMSSIVNYIVDYYQELKLDERNYYKNHLALLELRSRKDHQQLFKRDSNNGSNIFINDSEGSRSSSLFYLMRKNVIIVPYGNFQPPMYHKNMHDLLKFSLFGFVLAHELIHGFDASGLNFDFRGNLPEGGLYLNENKNFTKAIECLERTESANIDERIADIVGVRLAYNTYFDRQNVNPNASVPFAEFSLRRLFFLNMAQFFCGSGNGNFVDHDNDYVRLHQTLVNFEPFAIEFGCAPGDVMHPEEKCRVY